MEMTTVLVRKAITYDSLMKDTKELISNFGSKPKKITIEKVIEMTKEEFDGFKNNLWKDREFIKNNKEVTYFLVKEKGMEDKKGIIVDTAGYDFPRYTGVFVEESEIYQCKKCNKYFMEPPAISRKDNKSYVCSECGVQEAIEDFKNKEVIEFCRSLQTKANELGIEITIKTKDGFERRVSSNK